MNGFMAMAQALWASDRLLFGWWLGLGVISLFNIGWWIATVRWVARRQMTAGPLLSLWRRRQLWLSLVYVLVCAFRSVIPRIDVQRITLFNSWFASVMVGRTVATVAEVCFAVQWALLLRELSKSDKHSWAYAASVWLVPLISVAEIFSWYAVLTTSFIGNVIEESIWAAAALCLVLSAVTLWRRVARTYEPYVWAAIGLGVAYIVFMVTVDVPMYIQHWLADTAHGVLYLTISQGMRDTLWHQVVSYDWRDWQAEIAWMSLYFSVAVWSSIALIYVPVTKVMKD